VRLGVLTALTVLPGAVAFADPVDRLEASGFLGLMDFSDDIGLGGGQPAEQRPQSAPVFGARLTYTVVQSRGDLHLDLAVEPELSLTTSWTGYGFDEDRPSYFAPVIGYRANAMLRLGGTWAQPHVTAGFGGATVVTASPYMKNDTDPVFVWGVGATFPMADRWQLRFDMRQSLMASMAGNTTSNFELLIGVGARLGKPRPIEPDHEKLAVLPPPPPTQGDKDSDGDGIPDKLDGCPMEAEVVNGIDDQDGCPEPDVDGDKLLAPADKCPDKAEDFDNFQDDDGCPDDDNDKDGIADAKDKCPNDPETPNGVADDDGCPDQVPPAVVAALQSASKVKFEANKPRLNDAAKASLDRALGTILNNPKLKVAITVHPDKANGKASELAKKRADVVKWYLVEQGVAEKQLVPVVGVVAKPKAPLLEIAIAP